MPHERAGVRMRRFAWPIAGAGGLGKGRATGIFCHAQKQKWRPESRQVRSSICARSADQSPGSGRVLVGQMRDQKVMPKPALTVWPLSLPVKLPARLSVFQWIRLSWKRMMLSRYQLAPSVAAVPSVALGMPENSMLS
jgi:hypothetical protein